MCWSLKRGDDGADGDPVVLLLFFLQWDLISPKTVHLTGRAAGDDPCEETCTGLPIFRSTADLLAPDSRRGRMTSPALTLKSLKVNDNYPFFFLSFFLGEGRKPKKKKNPKKVGETPSWYENEGMTRRGVKPREKKH